MDAMVEQVNKAVIEEVVASTDMKKVVLSKDRAQIFKIIWELSQAHKNTSWEEAWERWGPLLDTKKS